MKAQKPLLWKQLFDLAVAATGLILCGPIMLVTAASIRLSMGKGVFFRQTRPGLHGKPFQLIKFRTMTDGRTTDGHLLPDRKRITRLGQFLRSSSLDELPELFNVLKGEMSIVGPRPLLMQYLDRYTPYQNRRHEVKPGITGWAQINGRNAISWEEKFALDIWYVDHQSLWIDLKITLLTIYKAIKREGISQPGQATMEEFQGSNSVCSCR
jgi:sugar transferase EpsL